MYVFWWERYNTVSSCCLCVHFLQKGVLLARKLNANIMAKKKSPPATHTPNPVPKTPNPHLWMPWAAAAVALLLYSTGFQNAMVAMDDHSATINNPAVLDFLAPFRGVFNLGMFAPLTWWVYGIAHALGKEQPFWYHFFSAALHAVNAFLVWRLARQLGAQPWQAFFVALAFGVHPLQVEAVAWIAGLSTPLFSLFMLLSMSAFLRYVDAGKMGRDYGLALLFLLMACLAKSAAVVLPLCLLALDVWLKRPVNRQTLLEKAPFFGISLLFGVLTLYSRGTSGHTVDAAGAGFSIIDRFWMASHTVLFYWGKLLWPLGLSIWYPFEKTASGAWPWMYYAAPVVLAGVLWAVYRYREAAPVLWAGVLFYAANIVLALPFYTIGEFELRSDRYNYVAGLGFFAILAALPLWQPVVQRKWSGAVTAVLAGLLLLCTALSYRRIGDWGSTITLIDKAIAVQGDNNGKAYLWRGMAYGDKGKGKQALADFDHAISRNPELIMAYKYRGTLMGLAKKYEQSVADLTKYLEKVPNDAEFYFNRGLSLLNLGRKDEAFNDFNKTIELNPAFAPAYRSRGNLYLERGETAKGEADLQEWEKRKKK